MVQEVYTNEMFQSPSPNRQSQPSALSAATSAMASTYGYPFYPTHTGSTQAGYPDYSSYASLPVTQPTSVDGQLTGLNPVSGTNGGSSPTWSGGCTYPANISPRAGSTGALHVTEDWGVPGGSAFQPMGGIPSQLPQSSVASYTGYPQRGTPTTFDHMSLGQYGTTASQSSVGTMQGLHPQPPSPDQTVAQSSTTPGGVASRHARPPYDWMKKQTAYQATPTNGQYTDSDGKTRTKDKYRIVYSEYQKVELEKEYLYSKYITIQRKAELSRSIQLSERQVKIWFQNRRAKERKQKRKREDMQMAAQSTTDIPANEQPMMKMEHSPVHGHDAQAHIKAEMHQHPDYSQPPPQQMQVPPH